MWRGTGGLVCLTLASGCFYVGTKTETSRTDLAPGVSRTVIGKPTLRTATRALEGGLEVRGVWQQTCWQRGVQRTQVTRTRRAKVKVGDPCDGVSGTACGVAALMSLAASPFSLAISAAFTSASLRGDRAATSVEETSTAPRVVRCDRPAAGLALDVTLPGRASARVILDGTGLGRVPTTHADAAMGAVITVAR